MPDLTAWQLIAGSPSVGSICPYCHDPLQPGEGVVTCPVDGAVHHAACWSDYGNRCATFGCSGRGAVVLPAAVAAAIEWVDPPARSPAGPPGPVIDINIPASQPAPPPQRPALNLRAVALWGMAAIVLLFALFRIFDDPMVRQSTPAPGVVAVATANATATARSLSDAATADAATAVAVSVMQATAMSDADDDGLLYEAESQYGTDAEDADSDGDGLEDGQEIGSYYNTDPLDADSDNDGLSDYQEIRTFRTKPVDADSDDDGLDDGVEVVRGLDPREWTPPTTEAVRQPTPRPTPRPAPVQPTPTRPSPVTGLRLINTDSDRPIGPLADGDTVSLRRTGSALSIEALVSGAGVGSVVFYWDGQQFCMNNADRCFENAAPYAMSGDQGGDYYNNWDWSRLSRGNHTVTVHTCTGANGMGDCAEALVVTFAIAR